MPSKPKNQPDDEVRAERVAEGDLEAPAPGNPPEAGNPEPPQPATEVHGGGDTHGEDDLPPLGPPAVAGEPTPVAPPPPNPPAVGADRPEGTPEEVADEAREQPPAPKADRKRDFPDHFVDDHIDAKGDRGRPEPEVPQRSSKREELKRELIQKFVDGTIDDEEMDILAAMRGANALRTATPTTALPTAPPKHSDGSVDAFPGQVEGVTEGQAEARVFFRSEGAEALKQVLPDGTTAKFENSVFSSTDPAVIGMLRRRIDDGDALFYEEDPAVAFGCPFCRFTSPSKANVNSHIRTRHPEHEGVQI